MNQETRSKNEEIRSRSGQSTNRVIAIGIDAADHIPVLGDRTLIVEAPEHVLQLLGGDQDVLVDVEDGEHLLQVLQNLVGVDVLQVLENIGTDLVPFPVGVVAMMSGATKSGSERRRRTAGASSTAAGGERERGR
ncbi:hypothetical protein U1Q18_023432 [Sarracenia purpurea var. burkii]